MESIFRGLVIYLFLLLVFRVSGKRTLAETTNFDLVLLLIISEVTQQAMVDNDHSMMNSALLIITLVGASIGLSLLKRSFPALDKWLDGVPLVIMEHGVMHRKRMSKARVDESDILSAGRFQHGLERLDQIKHAVMERDGSISVIRK
jgi:uncharacterized membrane protein YcaP (DUF421 family)